ncbi:MAG: trans-aconitate 2-methyltransferase [Bradymonadaceae bacterium]
MDIDERRQRLQSASGEVATLHVAFIGLADDLLEELGDGAAIGAEALADRAGVDPTYAERWLDAAYAHELIGGEDGKFRLTELGEAFLPEAEGSLMPLAVQSVLSGRLTDRLVETVVSGEQPGESLLGEFDNVAPWFGRMLEGKFRPYFRQHVLPALEMLETVDAEAGRVLDLGCGNGWYLREIADAHASIRGTGVDSMEASIRQAGEAATEAGVADRLSFEAGDLFDYRPSDPFDVVALNRTLHHVWAERDALFETIDASLADGGWLAIWEPAWPEDRRALRTPERRPLGMRNLAEHAMGNRLLKPEEIERALSRRNYTVTVERLDEVETLIVGRR